MAATKVKQYQNVKYDELISYAENNPNRNLRLESIENIPVKTIQDTTLDKIGLKGYTATNLNPTGILSLLLCLEDPGYYSLSNKNTRLQEIITITTKLQEETNLLKNSELARKRKKIHDLIGAVYNESNLEEKEYLELFHGISFMRNIHFVLMKETIKENIEEGESSLSNIKGEIVFSSNPIMWKKENPVWIVDFRTRWVAIPSENNSEDIHTYLATWLVTNEQNGWIIKWPEVDGSKVEIIEQLSLFPTWQITDKKLTKDILAFRLGRAKVIQTFMKWAECAK